MNTFKITAVTAWDTLQECAGNSAHASLITVRAIVGASQRAYGIATRPDALRTYRSIYRAVEIACLVTIYLCSSARDAWEQFLADQQLTAAAAIEQAAKPAASEQAESEESDPEATVEAKGIETEQEAEPAVTEEAEPEAAPRTPAAPWRELTSAQLRARCTQAGIPWSRVNSGRNLTKAEMILALQAAQAA